MSKSTLALVFAIIMGIVMTVPSYSYNEQVQAVIEDDGYTYDSNDPEEQEEQDEREQEQWEDAGKPGDSNNDDDSDDDKDDSDDPLPYCDTPEGEAASSCYDRQDYDDVTGLAPCNDGTQKANYKDCKDASKNDDDNDDNDLPICEYLVVKDCVVNEIGQKCLVGTSDDPCQDIFYGYDGDLKPGEKTFNPNSDNDNDNDSPQPVSTTTTTADCDTRSYNLDIKLAALNATSELLDTETDRLSTMYDDAITPEEIDSYNAQVDAQNARIDKYDAERIPLDAEVAKWNAECAA
jgi:hypothetical protein